MKNFKSWILILISFVMFIFILFFTLNNCKAESKAEIENTEIKPVIQQPEIKTFHISKYYGRDVDVKSVTVFSTHLLSETYDYVTINQDSLYIDCFINDNLVCTIPMSNVTKILYNY
jgi:hypothetical protein